MTPSMHDAMTPVRTAILLVRNARLIGLLTLGGTVCGVLYAVARGNEFRAEAVLGTPEGSHIGSGAVAGLASQFGMNIRTSGETPLEFYNAILTSNKLLSRAVAKGYPVVDGDDEEVANLIQHYGGSAERMGDRIDAVHQLRSHVSTRVDAASGIIRLEVIANTPSLAAAVADTLSRLVIEMSGEYRRRHAQANRKFVEERLGQAQQGLQEAEARLQRFYEQNRGGPQGSPQLAFEEERLQRQVDLRQSLFVSLSEEFERARIEEVRNTPSLLLVDSPELSVRDESPSPTLRGIAGALLGFLVGVAMVFVRAGRHELMQSNPDEYRELLSALGLPLRSRWSAGQD